MSVCPSEIDDVPCAVYLPNWKTLSSFKHVIKMSSFSPGLVFKMYSMIGSGLVNGDESHLQFSYVFASESLIEVCITDL